MKKQYLISLLGLATIFIPVGNSLLNTNQDLFNSAEESTPTGTITVNDDTSIVGVNSEGKVAKGDQLQAIEFNASYNSNTTNPYIIPFLNEDEDEAEDGNNKLNDEKNIHIYYGTNNDHLDVSASGLAAIGGVYTGNAKSGTYNLQLNAQDDSFATHKKFWSYRINGNEDFALTITSAYTKTPDKIGQIEIGTVGIISDQSERTTIEIKDTADDTSKGQISNIESDTATVKYEVTSFGNDIKGDSVDIKKVEWMSLNTNTNSWDPLATSDADAGDLIATNLTPATTYGDPVLENGKGNTEIVAEMSDGTTITATNEINSKDHFVESFKTDATAAEINMSPTIYYDTTNDILEIKGTIILNGSNITEIVILKEDTPIETNYKTFKPTSYTEFTYDVWTPNYIEDDKDGLENYSLKVFYEYEINNEKYKAEEKINLGDFLADEESQLVEKDLSRLTDKFRAGAIIGIIIAVLFFIAIFSWVMYISIRKYKSKEA